MSALAEYVFGPDLGAALARVSNAAATRKASHPDLHYVLLSIAPGGAATIVATDRIIAATARVGCVSGSGPGGGLMISARDAKALHRAGGDACVTTEAGVGHGRIESGGISVSSQGDSMLLRNVSSLFSPRDGETRGDWHVRSKHLVRLLKALPDGPIEVCGPRTGRYSVSVQSVADPDAQGLIMTLRREDECPHHITPA